MNRSTSILAGLALGILLGGPAATHASPACSCAPPGSPAVALGSSDVVFVGKAMRYDEPPPTIIDLGGESVPVVTGTDMIRWTMLASRGWKGDLPDWVPVYTARDGAACGADFFVGQSYLVYAYYVSSEEGFYRTWPQGTTFPAIVVSLCSRTRDLDIAWEDLAELGEPLWVVGTPGVPQILAPRPTPTAGETRLAYRVPANGPMRLSVYDASGRLIARLRDHWEAAAWRTATWDGRDRAGNLVPSGVYFAHIEAAGAASNTKIIIAR